MLVGISGARKNNPSVDTQQLILCYACLVVVQRSGTTGITVVSHSSASAEWPVCQPWQVM
jgi:hypothetical protein